MIEDRWPLVELLLCAADIAQSGYSLPITAAQDALGAASGLAWEAVCEAKAVAPYAFEYRGTLLAETLLEAAYRVAENRGAAA